jgi:hypothetical protein
MAEEDNRQLPPFTPELPSRPCSAPPNSPTSTHSQSQLVPIFLEDDLLRLRDEADLSNWTAAYDPSAQPNPQARPFPFQFPLPDINQVMADRFPKIEDLELGERNCRIFHERAN